MGKDSEKGKYSSPEGSATWEYISGACCALGAMCIGTLMGWNSPSLAEYMTPDSPISMTPEQASTLSASLNVGSASAPFFSIFIIDKIGKKNTILFSAVPMLLNWAMIVMAKSVIVLIIARLMAGVAMGTLLLTIPIYMGEILSIKRRGPFTGLLLIAFQVGVLFMFAIAPHLGVRTTGYVCLIVTLIFLACFWSTPESPYFLVMVGRTEDAERALEKLRGKTDVADEIELIKATHREKGKAFIKFDDTENGSSAAKGRNAFTQLFKIRGNLKSLFLGIVLTTVQHYCGFSTITSYCALILKAMGSQLDVYVATLTFSILQVISAAVYIMIAEKFNRKFFLTMSGLISSFFLMIIAVYFYLMDYVDMEVKKYAMIPLGSFFLLVIVLNVGVLPIPTVLSSEIFASDIKVISSCIVWITGSLLTVLSTKSYLLMAMSWGLGHSAPFLIYAVTTFVCTLTLLRFLPETRGKTLLEIQQKMNA